MNVKAQFHIPNMIQRNDVIGVVGARTNNLKNIDVDVLKNKFTVITGLSGSGKSSLAIDTVFAEGQRQYIESLSLFSRQFFEQNAFTDVDCIVGLQPTICIDQRRGAVNPRSTVGTMTEIYDFMRLLFAKVGTMKCPKCSSVVCPQTVDQICESVLDLPIQSKAMILVPLVLGRKGAHKEVFETIRKERLVRVRINGQLHDIDRLPELNPKLNHTIDAVADRVIIKEGIENRLLESLELSAKLGDGTIAVSFKPPDSDDWEELCFSTKHCCSICGESCPPVSTRTFSFNSPYGACQSCDGLGVVESFDIDRLIPEKDRNLSDAVVAWNALGTKKRLKLCSQLAPVLAKLGLDEDPVLSSLSPEQWQVFAHNHDKNEPGLLTVLEKDFATEAEEERISYLDSFRSSMSCVGCDGSRLNAIGNSVTIADSSIVDVCNMTISTASDWFQELRFVGNDAAIAIPILEEIKSRIQFLNQVGLGYLTISRASDSLSGGELQRTRLAKSIGNGLTGVCYVLDEPSIGLHANDNQKLIETIVELKERGNTLIVVEHDDEMMRAADQLIDIGPSAGNKGGQLSFQGSINELVQCDQSLTGDYLSFRKTVGSHRVQSVATETDAISLIGARGFNLKEVDVKIPIGCFTCVTGVSGSGKSTLIYRTLAPAIKKYFGFICDDPEPYNSIDGLQHIQRIVEINQKPLSRTPRGCAATYSGIFDDIRKIFAATKKSKQLGLTASRFSFNSKQGWCTECEGHGAKKISMKFMPDVYVNCPKCNGRRFNEMTLSVQFAGMNISDVLQLSVDEACDAFSSFFRISTKLECLRSVGLGYLPLGQPSTSLSGGEAQRIKLATELVSHGPEKSLYLMDEPTTGLHFHDCQLLIDVISKLVENGNTVLVIEHNLDIIAAADWVIDVGPGPGEQGGEIVAIGTPGQICKVDSSITGQCLSKRLDRKR